MKILIICKGFKKTNLNKLPWKYIYEVAKYLNSNNEVSLVTDEKDDKVDEIPLLYVNKLFTPLKGESNELLALINQEKPDKCIMLLGMTSFLRNEFKIQQPVVGVFTSPIYDFTDLVKNIGLFDLFKYRKYTLIHIINSLLPSYFVKKYEDHFEKIIFLSNYTCNKLVNKGFPKEKSVIIPVGIDEHFLDPPNLKEVNAVRIRINPEDVPIVMYFTSPLTLRGTDTLVKAFGYLRKENKCKLVFLSRIDYTELKKEENFIKKLAKKYEILDSMEIISEYLTPDDLKIYLAVADVVCIPFKIVISDVPVSILEAMTLEKPVVSTKVASLPELLPNGITVETNNPKELEIALSKLIDNKQLLSEIGRKNKNFMDKYPKWSQIAKKFAKNIQE